MAIEPTVDPAILSDVIEQAAGLIGRAALHVNAVACMADDKTPPLTLLADMALWKDRYESLGGEAFPVRP